jgi:hypothetical protein
MRTIQQIYDDYKIMPSLQLHQLRVGSVAKIICENSNQQLDTDNIVLACLFHDMGNIIKSDLPRFPDFLEPQGLEYWQSVKNDFIKKYGNEEHVATERIAQEVNLPAKAFEYLSRTGFSKVGMNVNDPNPGFKICSYSDMRVGPYGILSMDERLAEGRKRYEARKHAISSDDTFIAHSQALVDIEEDIFRNSKIRSEDINDDSVRDIIDDLRTYSL